MSQKDCHLLHQKVRQKCSVIITNTCVFVVFMTKRELNAKMNYFLISSKVFVLITEIDELFDVIKANCF